MFAELVQGLRVESEVEVGVRYLREASGTLDSSQEGGDYRSQDVSLVLVYGSMAVD